MSFIRTAGKVSGAFIAVVASLVVLVLLAIGAWYLGWFVKEKNVNKAGEVAQQSYSRQVGIAQQTSTLATSIATVDVQITTATPDQAAALRAQRTAMVTQLCDQAAQLNDTAQPSAAAVRLITQECK